MAKVITFGTFDILHPGHEFMLAKAKEYGDELVVVIARDKTVCSVKGKNPKHGEEVRLKNVSDLKIADRVRLGCIDDKYQVIREENPDIVALGYDQSAFIDNLAEAIRPDAQIVRVPPYMPDKYKSSKMI
ncbi:MAG: adenylyltransferase/cytidyltransferase family protein [Candidatus Magasanikbacteria bacterium]|jgi:FAD synthetase